jgi:transposase, IS30 family
MLVELPNGHSADVVADALARHITALPEQLRRSLTWDHGKEMAAHARFSVATDVPVYFCDPRSPWQRGSNQTPTDCYASTSPNAATWPPFSPHDLDTAAAELKRTPSTNPRLDDTLPNTRPGDAMTP